MRPNRRSPAPLPPALERMGGREERTSEIGRARAEAERREAQDLRFDALAEERPLHGRRRGGRTGHQSRSIRKPRRIGSPRR